MDHSCLTVPWCSKTQGLKSMIPPVWTDPVWGRAQYGPVQPLGRTGPSPRLAVSDSTGLVWTSLHTLAILTLFLSQVPLKTWLILTFITAHLWIPTMGEIMTVLSVYLVPSRYISPIKRPIQWKNTLNLDTVLDWSKSVQASSVQVQKEWGSVRSRSKDYSDWIGLDLDGPGVDWSNAELVESLLESIDDPLILIFWAQWRSHWMRCCLARKPIIQLRFHVATQALHCPRCEAWSLWCSIHAHFWDIVAMLSQPFLNGKVGRS